MRRSAFALCNLQFYICAELGADRGVRMSRLVRQEQEQEQIKTGLT